MKWFIKCLRHYADFSGRARRKEYWMFTLFNGIALFVWAFVLAILGAIEGNLDDGLALQIAIQFSWMALLGLPGLAVSIRRLHDLGKSGWMALITLIPFVGAIWMVVMMATEGQAGPNRFGSDPKTSPETFPESAKLTSAGVVIIVGVSISLIANLCMWLFPELYFGNSHSVPFAAVYQSLIANIAVIAVGILLVGASGRERIRPALCIVLVVTGYFCIAGIAGLSPQFRLLSEGVFHIRFLLNTIAVLLLNLFVTLLAALTLFAPQNRAAVRGAAVAAMAAGGVRLVTWMFVMVNNIEAGTINNILLPLEAISIVCWIVFAWALFSRHETPKETAMPSKTLRQNLQH